MLENHRVWVDDEWGLRHYMQERGALPLQKTQRLRAGDIIVSSALEPCRGTVTALLATAAPTLEIRPRDSAAHHRAGKPLRVFQRRAGSLLAVRHVDGVIDRVRASRVGERHATSNSYIDMKAPEAKDQIVSGIWPTIIGCRRAEWSIVKSPSRPRCQLKVNFYVPTTPPRATLRCYSMAARCAPPTVRRAGPGQLIVPPRPIQPAGAHSDRSKSRVDHTFRAAAGRARSGDRPARRGVQ